MATVGLDQTAGSLCTVTGGCISASLFEQQSHRTEEEQEEPTTVVAGRDVGGTWEEETD